MKLPKNFKTYSAIIFLILAVTWSLIVVLSREVKHVVGEEIEIRFSHSILDPGFREAMNELCKDFEEQQRLKGVKVKVTSLEIPPNVYTQWARTQLLGETAPEIMMISYEITRDAELVARYFRSMSEEIDLPNPYNKGTIHDGVPLRQTYIDGMRISGYIFSLAEHYGIPQSFNTNRLVANRRLMEAILAEPENAELTAAIGPSLIPHDYDQFIALCDSVKPYSEKIGIPLIPIAANKDTGRIILDYSVGSQNQELLLNWPKLRDARVNEAVLLDHLMNDKQLWDHPAYRQGLQLVREIGLRVQPGFMQLRAEDSNFAFATERALMTYVSSQGASSLRALTGGTIDFVVFPIPFPSKDHPRFGDYAFGPLSEANLGGSNPFGVVNYSSPERQELAMDFLRYIASFSANQTFTDYSGLLPAISGVKPGPLAEPFAIHLDGYAVGPPVHMGVNDVRSLVDTYLYILTSPNGSVDEFLEKGPPAFKERAIDNLNLAISGVFRTSARQDPLFASYYWLKKFDTVNSEESERKFSLLVDASDGNECEGTMREPLYKAYLKKEK